MSRVFFEVEPIMISANIGYCYDYEELISKKKI